MTTISAPKVSPAKGGQSLLSLPTHGRQISKAEIPQDFSNLSAQEEFYLTSGLRWAALRLEELLAKDETHKPSTRAIALVFEAAFKKTGCKLPDPTQPLAELSKAAEKFYSAKGKICAEAAPHIAARDEAIDQSRAKVRYFDLLAALQKSPDQLGLPPNNNGQIETLRTYINLMLSRISGHYVNLVYSVARKGRPSSAGLKFSAAFPGLIEGLVRFQPERNFRVITLARNWIKQELSRTLHHEKNSIYYPERIKYSIRKLESLAGGLGMTYIDLTDKRLLDAFAKAEKVSPQKLPEIVGRIDAAIRARVWTTHFQMTRGSESTEMGFSDDRVASVWEQVATEEANQHLVKALRNLSEREARIIEMRFGLSGDAPKTLDECSALLDITRERVRQIQVAAIDKLRGLIKPEFFRIE